MPFEKDFTSKVLEQNKVVNENIEVNYFEIDMESEDGVLTDYDAIEQQIGIWFNTNIGERYFNDAYGNPIIELVHRDRESITSEDLNIFYDKLEKDVELVKVDRDTAEIAFVDYVMYIKLTLYVAGLSQTVAVSQEISV